MHIVICVPQKKKKKLSVLADQTFYFILFFRHAARANLAGEFAPGSYMYVHTQHV